MDELPRAKAAYRSACEVLVRRNIMGKLETLTWRHHGLGMLQAELSETMRVHVWHPELRTIPFEGFRDVHDHRFTLTSYIAAGELVDVSYEVIRPGTSIEHPPCNTEMFEIVHAKMQDRVTDVAKSLGPVYAGSRRRVRYKPGAVYVIPRRDFHTTFVEKLCVTVVNRSNFDDKPARVLGFGTSAIIPETPANRALRKTVLQSAEILLTHCFGAT